MAHRAKTLEERQIIKYTREDLMEAVQNILNGFMTVDQAFEKYKVPPRTLRRYVKHAREVMKSMGNCEHYDLEMMVRRGNDAGLSSELMDRLKHFVEDAFDIGVPRSKSQLAIDIQEYVRQERIQVPFIDQKPDREFFEVFMHNDEGKLIKFLHPKDVAEFLNRNIGPEKWMSHVKNYVLNASGQTINEKKYIFRIESQRFKTSPDTRAITAVVVYDGCGNIHRWIVVTDGIHISTDFVVENSERVMMLKTDDGSLSSNTLKSALIVIRRRLAAGEPNKPAVVYLDHFLAQHLSFSVWNYCVDNNLYPMAVPRAICIGERNLSLGVMAKYSSHMLLLILQRFTSVEAIFSEMNFMFLHLEIVRTVKFDQIMKQSMRILKLKTVLFPSPKVAGSPMDGVKVEQPDVCDSAVASAWCPLSSAADSNTKGAKGMSVKKDLARELPGSISKGSGVFQIYRSQKHCKIFLKHSATQTENSEAESEEEDDPVVAENISELKRKYASDTIRPEEFDTELED